MARPRVTLAMRKRLSAARDPVSGKVRRGGVLLVPAIMDPDTFDRIAGPHQDDLIASTLEDRPRPVAASVVKQINEATADVERQRGHEEAFRKEKEAERLGNQDYLKAQQARVRGIIR